MGDDIDDDFLPLSNMSLSLGYTMDKDSYFSSCFSFAPFVLVLELD